MGRIGDFFIRFGAACNEEGQFRVVLRTLRRLVRGGFLVGLGLGVVLLFLIDWVGERNLFTTFFLYLPAQIWLLPLAGFACVAACLLDWKLLVATVLCGAAVVWFYLDWETSGERKGRGGRELVVMTFNRGQRSGSLRPFKQRHDPDLLAMQEAAGQAVRYLKADGYTDLLHGEDVGEFLLLSKYPIVDKGLLEYEASGIRHAVAGWFVVDFAGEEIVVYNVHMRTPRDQLKAFKRGAFLRGLWPFSEQARSYQSFWDVQISLAEQLLAHIREESRPVIVVGDFNAPDRGYIYGEFRSALQDAHEEAGRGFGWTFPGTTRNPISLFGPWLRIDHQFADDSWRVLGCEAETGRKSQHLAVAARYERSE